MFNLLILNRGMRARFYNKISPVSTAFLSSCHSPRRAIKKDCYSEVSPPFLRAVSEQQSEYLYAI